MLPGFRFLLAAIVLSVSIVTFGLGAAALLRAAHEEFASIPTRRVTPEPYFAQVAEAPAATLAMLRVEPAPQGNAPVGQPAPALVEEPAPEAVPVPKVEMEKLAALSVDVAPPAEPAKPEVAVSEAPAVAPPTDETQPETKMAALDATPASPPAPTVENASIPSEQIVMPAMTDSTRVATSDKPVAKIAALGSPAAPVAAEAEAKKSSAKQDRSEARKKQRAERARERRRIAARRARLAAQQAAAAARSAAIQQPADLFGEATPQTQPATRQR
jgi:hypothetical protein